MQGRKTQIFVYDNSEIKSSILLNGVVVLKGETADIFFMEDGAIDRLLSALEVAAREVEEARREKEAAIDQAMKEAIE